MYRGTPSPTILIVLPFGYNCHLSYAAISLSIIFLLGLMILIGYSVVAFVFFNSFFHQPENRLFCDTLFECVFTVVRLGALAEPPLGDVSSMHKYVMLHWNTSHLLSSPPLPLSLALSLLQNISTGGVSYAVAFFRLAYGLSFFIVVTTLGLNVVIAILVDNFSALRQKKVVHFVNICIIMIIDRVHS